VSFEPELKERIENDIKNRMNRGASRIPNHAGLIPGLLMVLVGTIILLDHLGYIHAEEFWKFWPLLVVGLGIAKLFSPGSRVGGVILILVGTFLQMNKLGLTRLNWWDIWPIALIAVGISLMFERLNWRLWKSPTLPSGSGASDVLSEFAVFGNVERRINVNNFRGGSINSVFGSVEVDLRSAEIEGEEAVISVEALFSSVELTVPERWVVVCQAQSVFGSYGDETRPPIPDVLNNSTRKRLVLRGKAVFGAITVKN
jgi:predicted membrane protein